MADIIKEIITLDFEIDFSHFGKSFAQLLRKRFDYLKKMEIEKLILLMLD